MTQIIRVLVVDDSAFVRKVVSQMLTRSPFIEVVGTARDGEEALEMTERLRPDVVTLDLIMPRVNGVEYLRRQMPIHPVPVVICSIAHDSGELAIDAFDAGAVEFVQKPTALATDRVYEIADELVAKVKAASQVRMATVASAPAPAPAEAVAQPEPAATVAAQVGAPTGAAAPAVIRPAGLAFRATRSDVLVIGVSTGGPQALRQLIPQFPPDFPVPILMVLHMPIGYTQMFAERLDAVTGLEVVEARDGELLRPGVAFLAPAGRHLTVERQPDGSVRTHLDLRPYETQHRPAVDVLFRSAAEVFGPRVVGVVLTGMGSDGLLGAGYIKAQGGRVLTEAEASCVVYGMPRVVDEAALSDGSYALDDMARGIAEML